MFQQIERNMKYQLIKFLESALLNINSNECALSVNIEDGANNKDCLINILLNSYDNEKLVIDTFYSALYEFYLFYTINIQSLKYAIDVERIEDCTQLIFSITDEINF